MNTIYSESLKKLISSKHTLLSLLVIFNVIFLFGQKDVSLNEKSKVLLSDFEKHHLQPRKLDVSLGKQIHENFMSSLDKSKLLFTKSDMTILDSLALSLNTEIPAGKLNYYNEVKSRFLKNVAQLKIEVTAILSKKDFSVIPSHLGSEENKEYQSKTANLERWKILINNKILNNVLDLIEDDNYNYSKDSLKSYVSTAKKISKQEILDFYQNVSSDSTLLESIYLNTIANAFDPHSNYFSPEMKKQFTEELSSEREIFGLVFVKNLEQKFEITSIVPGSSAWMSGEIHKGDIILKLKFGEEKEVPLEGLTYYQASELFSKTNSTSLKITFSDANNEIRNTTLQKAKIYSEADVIKTAILQGEEKIGYISLPDFYMDWTDTTNLGCANDVAKALIKLKQENISGLILDLRENGGGSLKEAIDLVGIFIDYGPILIQKDDEGTITSLKDFNRGSVYSGPLMILINNNSASASEVVAGAIQDYNRGLIVGQKSFGKATGQGIIPLDPTIEFDGDDTEGMNKNWGFVKLTQIGLYRINLTTNQKNGVTPDITLLKPYKEEEEREEDLPNCLDLLPIEKKIYYTPFAQLPVETLNSKSHSRQVAKLDFIEATNLFDQYDSLVSYYFKSNLTFDKVIEVKKQLDIIQKNIDNSKTKDTIFTPTSMRYDMDVYKINKYLETYQESFFERILSDSELKEAFQIMTDFIKQ